jgi:hypothetical protein
MSLGILTFSICVDLRNPWFDFFTTDFRDGHRCLWAFSPFLSVLICAIRGLISLPQISEMGTDVFGHSHLFYLCWSAPSVV